MDQNHKLQSYRKKRDFSITPEPKGEKSEKESKKPIFVVQKHEATHLHYDFRLEINGVLKSWAIPKGPSLNPKEKRLAMETEDHPFEYKDFEGIIPQGQYGAGTVLMWDKGTYESLFQDISLIEDYKNGHIVIKLNGQKLKGKFTLQRIRDANKPQWLLIKLQDNYVNLTYNILNESRSVLSGKTLKEINLEAAHD